MKKILVKLKKILEILKKILVKFTKFYVNFKKIEKDILKNENTNEYLTFRVKLTEITILSSSKLRLLSVYTNYLVRTDLQRLSQNFVLGVIQQKVPNKDF